MSGDETGSGRSGLNGPTGGEDPSPGDRSDVDPLIDAHRDFIRKIDDSARLGYSALGVASLLAMLLSAWLMGTALFSLAGIGILLGSGALALLAGRFLALAPHERRLRKRVIGYCERRDVELSELLGAVLEAGRFVFFIKLFYRTGGPTVPGVVPEDPLERSHDD